MTHDCWLSVGEGRRVGGGGHSAADTRNDWESAACSHYLVPCIVIITPALSAPMLPSLLAIVIVIDWCGDQNSTVWKGIRHTSHNRPAIWSSPPPPSHWLLLHLSVPLVLAGSVSSGISERSHRFDTPQERYSVFSHSAWCVIITVCLPHAWIDKYIALVVLGDIDMWHDRWAQLVRRS